VLVELSPVRESLLFRGEFFKSAKYKSRLNMRSSYVSEAQEAQNAVAKLPQISPLRRTLSLHGVEDASQKSSHRSLSPLAPLGSVKSSAGANFHPHSLASVRPGSQDVTQSSPEFERLPRRLSNFELSSDQDLYSNANSKTAKTRKSRGSAGFSSSFDGDSMKISGYERVKSWQNSDSHNLSKSTSFKNLKTESLSIRVFSRLDKLAESCSPAEQGKTTKSSSHTGSFRNVLSSRSVTAGDKSETDILSCKSRTFSSRRLSVDDSSYRPGGATARHRRSTLTRAKSCDFNKHKNFGKRYTNAAATESEISSFDTGSPAGKQRKEASEVVHRPSNSSFQRSASVGKRVSFAQEEICTPESADPREVCWPEEFWLVCGRAICFGAYFQGNGCGCSNLELESHILQQWVLYQGAALFEHCLNKLFDLTPREVSNITRFMQLLLNLLSSPRISSSSRT